MWLPLVHPRGQVDPKELSDAVTEMAKGMSAVERELEACGRDAEREKQEEEEAKKLSKFQSKGNIGQCKQQYLF